MTKRHRGIVLIVFLLLYLLFIHTRAFPTQDESWFLQAGARFVHGEVPYKDFQFIYHPFGIYLNAASFALFGVSVLASRLMAILFTLAAVISIWWLSQRWRWPSWLAALAIAGYVFWGPTHINFIWPVMICLSLALLTTVGWQKVVEASPRRHSWLVIVGVTTALVLLTKQNFGLALLAANAAYLILIGELKNWRTLLSLALGFLGVLGAQLTYWVATSSLIAFLSDMKFLLLDRVILQGVLNSALPWDYPGPLMYRLAKLAVYVLPVLISLVSLVMALKQKRSAFLFISVTSIMYYCLSIRPTTDVVHLAPLLALSMLALAGMYYAVQNNLVKKSLLGGLVILVLLGAYHGLIKNYYRWDMPLWQQNMFFHQPSAKVWVNPGVSAQMLRIKNYFTTLADQPKEVFVYSYAPYLYLLLDARNPTRYDYLHTGVISEETIDSIVKILESKQLEYVISNTPLVYGEDKIANYILANYQWVEEAGEYTVWRRK